MRGLCGGIRPLSKFTTRPVAAVSGQEPGSPFSQLKLRCFRHQIQVLTLGLAYLGITLSRSSSTGVGHTAAGAGQRGGLGTGVLANLANDDVSTRLSRLRPTLKMIDSTCNSQDGTGWPNLVLRGFQTFTAFINLCIYIALAVAQKGDGHIAGMTGWGLFFNSEVLLHAAAFCKLHPASTR